MRHITIDCEVVANVAKWMKVECSPKEYHLMEIHVDMAAAELRLVDIETGVVRSSLPISCFV